MYSLASRIAMNNVLKSYLCKRKLSTVNLETLMPILLMDNYHKTGTRGEFL